MHQQFISAQVPKHLAVAARVEAAKMNISRSELFRRALTSYIDTSVENKSALDSAAWRRDESSAKNTRPEGQEDLYHATKPAK